MSLAHALKKADPSCRIVYIGLKGESLEDSLRSRYKIFDEVRSVASGKFRRYHGESFLAHLTDLRTLALNIRDFFRVINGISSARKILKQVNPNVVFSKGSFVAVPVGIAAHRLKIPIVTHDSDTMAGLANRIIGRYATFHATGMPAKYYNYPKETIHYVGIPIDERIKVVTEELKKNYKKELRLPSNSQVLVIGGAGLGAHDVNNTILSIAPDLLALFPKLHIVHISGQSHEKDVREAYKNVDKEELPRWTVIGFTSDFYKYTGSADVVITRAGATTIAELAAQRKAVILIPAPHLTGGHQLKNAHELHTKGAAVVIDNDAPPEELLKAISDILSSNTKRESLETNISSLAMPDAADKLAELLINTAQTNALDA